MSEERSPEKTEEKEVAVKKGTEPRETRFDLHLERLFDDFFRRRWTRPLLHDWSALTPELPDADAPRVDVLDKGEHLLVRAELPGISKEDIEVSVTGNSISLKGSSRKEEEHEEGAYHRREISSAFISRTVTLPNEVDPDGAKAQLRDGMLEVTLPKSARARQKRVEVEA